MQHIQTIAQSWLADGPADHAPAGRRLASLIVAVAFAAALLAVPAQETPGPSQAVATPVWSQDGKVSWYGPGFHGRQTANGEIFDTNELTMAHRSLAFDTKVRVTNLDNGRSIVVRVNDRGPYVGGRIADLSHAAASRLGFVEDGVVHARIELI
jgi:rare lipoprotein A